MNSTLKKGQNGFKSPNFCQEGKQKIIQIIKLDKEPVLWFCEKANPKNERNTKIKVHQKPETHEIVHNDEATGRTHLVFTV